MINKKNLYWLSIWVISLYIMAIPQIILILVSNYNHEIQWVLFAISFPMAIMFSVFLFSPLKIAIKKKYNHSNFYYFMLLPMMILSCGIFTLIMFILCNKEKT